MKFRFRHRWLLPYREAVDCQVRLRRRLRTDSPLDVAGLETVAGADVAYETRRRVRAGRPNGKPAARFVSAVVVMAMPSLQVIETASAGAETSFPYIPGLLSFREGPALERAFAKLRRVPDAILFDGQGIAHPRGLGLAAHLGLLLNIPSVGCAKSRLYGETRGEPARRRGSRRAIRAPKPRQRASRKDSDRPPPAFEPGQRVGTLLRTRDGVKPVWVSCGHRIDLPSAERLVLRTARKYRLPEPIRVAHRLVNAELRKVTTAPGR